MFEIYKILKITKISKKEYTFTYKINGEITTEFTWEGTEKQLLREIKENSYRWTVMI